ncbi:MAG: hypothetical protein A4E31_01240 [Methanomassiliicoccales archaeon PtaU1.Bin030]|nr:MAG: hypothetical protein A4E31_01240 [Methanomassiliicoccales archaeon PtaU1.Bin030]
MAWRWEERAMTMWSWSRWSLASTPTATRYRTPWGYRRWTWWRRWVTCATFSPTRALLPASHVPTWRTSATALTPSAGPACTVPYACPRAPAGGAWSCWASIPRRSECYVRQESPPSMTWPASIPMGTGLLRYDAPSASAPTWGTSSCAPRRGGPTCPGASRGTSGSCR